jgi:hypothetical protein
MLELPEIKSRESYIIRDNGEYFYTGRTLGKGQILFGILAGENGQEIAAVWFDPAGKFSRFTTQKITTLPSETRDAALHRHVIEFQRTNGFRPDTIRVKKFSIPDRFIKIEDIPEHYQEFLNNPNDYEPERQQELADDIRTWIQDGDFVLWWGEDYYLDSSGEVVSS